MVQTIRFIGEKNNGRRGSWEEKPERNRWSPLPGQDARRMKG